MDPLNPKATRSSAMPAQPRGRVGRSLIPGGLLVISLVAAWYWFRAGTREGLPEARARILLADIEVSLGSCAETVPHGIRAFVKDRSAELATPIALVHTLRVDFERHAIARRPPSEGKRSDQLMTGGDRVNPARIWDRADGRVTATFDGSADNDGPARLSDDGTRVYIGSRPGDPGVWRVDGGAPLGMLRLDRYFAAKGAAFTWDGDGVLLSGETDPHDINTGALIAWDIARGTHRVLAQGCGINAPKLNDDGNQVTVGVVTCPGDHEERLSTGFAPTTRESVPFDATRQWDIGFSREGRQGLRPPDKWLSHGLLSPDGESLAVWSSSGTASVHDARTGTVLGVLRHGSDDASGPGSSEIPVADVSFDAAGDRVAMGDAGGGAVFWDLARREPVFDVAPGSPAFAWVTSLSMVLVSGHRAESGWNQSAVGRGPRWRRDSVGCRLRAPVVRHARPAHEIRWAERQDLAVGACGGGGVLTGRTDRAGRRRKRARAPVGSRDRQVAAGLRPGWHDRPSFPRLALPAILAERRRVVQSGWEASGSWRRPGASADLRNGDRPLYFDLAWRGLDRAATHDVQSGRNENCLGRGSVGRQQRRNSWHRSPRAPRYIDRWRRLDPGRPICGRDLDVAYTHAK